jgi:hypothetical protein
MRLTFCAGCDVTALRTQPVPHRGSFWVPPGALVAIRREAPLLSLSPPALYRAAPPYPPMLSTGPIFS